MAEDGSIDFDKLIDNINMLSNKKNDDIQDASAENDKEKHILEPTPTVNPNLTSNEKTRARNLGLELFTGGIKAIVDIQKQNADKKKMENKPGFKLPNMKELFGKLIGSISKIFNIPMLITSLIDAIPEILKGVFKFLQQYILPIFLGAVALFEIFKNKETWIKIR